MPTTARGITYPDGSSTYPETTWWSNLATSTNTALDNVAASAAPKSHTHAVADVNNLQVYLDAKANTTHTHALADVSGLQAALDAKAAASHTHTIANVTNLQSTLDAKAAATHSHVIADVADLRITLDAKAAVGHTHTTAQVTGLDTALAGKAPTTHSHVIADVTDLQTTLDAKAAVGHTHAIANVTGLQAALDAKALASHQHAIADVQNLQTNLDAKATTQALNDGLAGKSNEGHTHVMAEIIDWQAQSGGGAPGEQDITGSYDATIYPGAPAVGGQIRFQKIGINHVLMTIRLSCKSTWTVGSKLALAVSSPGWAYPSSFPSLVHVFGEQNGARVTVECESKTGYMYLTPWDSVPLNSWLTGTVLYRL